MLKRTLLILCCVASAHAAPSNNAADDIERYLAERGIVAQMDQMRQSVGDTASDLVGNAMTFFQLIFGLSAFAVAMGVFALIAVSWVCFQLNEYDDSKK